MYLDSLEQLTLFGINKNYYVIIFITFIFYDKMKIIWVFLLFWENSAKVDTVKVL